MRGRGGREDFRGFEDKPGSFYEGTPSDVGPGLLSDKEYQKVLDEAKKEADKWIYASKIAAINKNRDPNFTGLGYETVYMYLSHFVDIKTGILDRVNPYYSDNVYYSAWIVNDDRKTYDTFLNGIIQQSQADKYIEFLDKGELALTFLGKTFHIEEQMKSVYRLHKYSTYIAIATESQNVNWKRLVEAATPLYNQSRNFNEFLGKFRKYLENEDYSEQTKDYFIKLIVEREFGNQLFTANGLSDYFHRAQLTFGRDMIDKFRWIALVQYNGMRVSQRMIRYYSGQGFDF